MAPDVTDAVLDLAKRRGYLWPSYECYGGLAGFYDYGPLGAAMKGRLERLWRHVFQATEPTPAVEVACPRVTPHAVLKASGHVDEFTDLMVRCTACRQAQRADHLVAAAGFEGNADALGADEVDAEVARLRPKCPSCGAKDWEGAAPQNLMNQTEIGPGSGRVGFLRPETAQGIFTGFPHLLRFFRGRLPFAGLQVGGSHRNEISPRQGMLRLREFHMMEAEVFFADTSAPFAPFAAVRDQETVLVPAEPGGELRCTFGEAVERGVVRNEALAYFLARTQEFLLLAGMDPQRLRFRQHLRDEMAHYARDCWDAEFHSGRYGWVECVGVADRGCYDLTQHAVHSGRTLTDPVTGEAAVRPSLDFHATVPFPEPITVAVVHHEPVLGVLGKTFKAEAKRIAHAVEQENLARLRSAHERLAGAKWPLGMDAYDASFKDDLDAPDAPLTVHVDGQEVKVPPDAYRTGTRTWSVRGARIVPEVIEPSFGVDRILYALWEHAYEHTEKGGEPYTRLRLSPHVAPVQVAVLPLTSKDGLPDRAEALEWRLRAAGLRTDRDESGNIGRRYARQDEAGTPFCVTVDDQTHADGTVTVRERDSTSQVRVPEEDLAAHLRERFTLAAPPTRVDAAAARHA